VKDVIFDENARKIIKTFPKEIRLELGKYILQLQSGFKLDMPVSKAMSTIDKGAYEIRIKDNDGNYRVFYYQKYITGILIFHAFMKKTQKTPKKEIDIAKKRLKILLGELKNG